MTQPDTIPAPASTNSATHPTVGPSALTPLPTLDPRSLLQACIDEAGLSGEDLTSLAVVSKVILGESLWAVGEKAPGADHLQVVVLFEGDQSDLNGTHVPGDVRAYVAPLSPASPMEKRWIRYNLSRSQPFGYSAVIMTQPRFIEEVAGEFTSLAGVRDTIFDDNSDLREALEKILGKANETTTPAMNRLASIVVLVMDALKEEEEEEGE